MTSTPWIENDRLFFDEAKGGQRWQEYVARFLGRCGLDATSAPLMLRKDIDDAWKFRDTHDIWCEGLPIEVKSRKVRFTTPDDFPYPTIFVDTVKKWEGREWKPFAYICISTMTGRMICLPGYQSDGWNQERRRDATRDYDDWFYSAPREQWRPIERLVTAIAKYKTRTVPPSA